MFQASNANGSCATTNPMCTAVASTYATNSTRSTPEGTPGDTPSRITRPAHGPSRGSRQFSYPPRAGAAVVTTAAMRTTRLPALIFAAGLLVWIANAAILWLSAAPLGHDEAQYALAARDLLAGEEPRWFYVSSGMSALSAIGVVSGDGEVAARLPAFVLGIGFVLAAGGLAWRVYGAATAAGVVAVLAGMRSVMRLSAELLSDLPATAFLLAGTAVIVAEIARASGEEAADRPLRWRVVLAAPLLAAALYLRYASCVPIAILGAAVLVVGARPIARRPAPIAATAALFLALLVPHARAALDATGSPLGILLASKDVPYRTWLGEGLATYATSNPVTYYGLLAAPILLAGLAAVARARDRRTVLLWLVAVADIVAIGLVSHAQARYILFGTTLLVVLGVDVLRRWIAARPPRARRVLGAAAAVAIAVGVGAGRGGPRETRRAPGREQRRHARGGGGDPAGCRGRAVLRDGRRVHAARVVQRLPELVVAVGGARARRADLRGPLTRGAAGAGPRPAARGARAARHDRHAPRSVRP